MTYLTVAESGLVLAMGKRDIASFAAVYFNIFGAFILGGRGVCGHYACSHGADGYQYYQKFKFHIDSTLEIRTCLKTKINPTLYSELCCMNLIMG